ncbi:hypothetical protein AB4Z54_75315, partial [Streptomyces sp. MCAF7]
TRSGRPIHDGAMTPRVARTPGTAADRGGPTTRRSRVPDAARFPGPFPARVDVRPRRMGPARAYGPRPALC